MSENAGISWLFNPPGTPHFNGVSEAMVKLVKISLEKILGKAEVFEEELNTIVVLIEGILNSRPITAVNQDIEDAQALTPNCFIRSGFDSNERMLEPSNSSALNIRWRRTRELSEHFWKRWRREVLPQWRERKKWRKDIQDLRDEELVWILDEKDEVGRWRLGRVQKKDSWLGRKM